MQIAIGSDHVGFELKQEIIAYLKEKNYQVTDFGPTSSERTNYPIYGQAVGNAVSSQVCDLGILICGTGVGISISANKIDGIRAVVCSEPYSAKLSREHNNTNILAFGSRVIGVELAKMIVDSWLSATYEGGRHAERVAMIEKIEQNQTI